MTRCCGSCEISPEHWICSRAWVIHRDVKPSNIMVTPSGHAVLTDFGLALSAEEGTIGSTFGSVHYIAPEQAVSSAQAVAQSDLYSLVCVIRDDDGQSAI